jgi:hypothetical protein
MSLILDALKRKKPTDDPSDRSAGAHEAHADAVLSTLGYRQPRPRRAGLSVKMLLLYGAAAMAIGFVGLSLLILLFAPPEAATPGSHRARAHRATGAPTFPVRWAVRRRCLVSHCAAAFRPRPGFVGFRTAPAPVPPSPLPLPRRRESSTRDRRNGPLPLSQRAPFHRPPPPDGALHRE